METGLGLISRERIRQVEQEGWTPEHDSQYCNEELIHAARCYSLPGVISTTPSPSNWPWGKKWWKPSDDPIRNRIKAGALIAADIDRLQGGR